MKNIKKMIIKREEIKEMKILEYLNQESIKESNYQMIHEKYQNESEKKFDDMIDDLNILFKDRNLDEFQLIMISRESRKIYYLMINDIQKNEIHFILKNDSIMKNKIFLLRMIQLFNHKEMKIHYLKSDRKNQSQELISRDNREYIEKIKRYS